MSTFSESESLFFAFSHIIFDFTETSGLIKDCPPVRPCLAARRALMQQASRLWLGRGRKELYKRATLVLSAMGRLTYVGPDGAGQLSKLGNQAIVGPTIGIVAEAMLLGQKGRADAAAMRERFLGI